MALKRRHGEDSDTSLPLELDLTAFIADYDVESRGQTPELVYSSKRRREDNPFDDSLDSDSSPDDASDLFDDLFTPPLSASPEADLQIFFDAPAPRTDTDEDEDGFTTDDEDISPPRRASKTVPQQSSSMGPPPLPLGIKPVGPAIGQWTELSPSPNSSQYNPHSQSTSRSRERYTSASPVLPQQHRRLPTPQTQYLPQSNVDALFEQYLDVNNVVDNSVALSTSKSWIDRYMTIPICGYLNRASAEQESDTIVAATSVAGVSKPAETPVSKKRAFFKRSTSAPSVVGLKRTALFTGKGKEMVGLGVIVGDLLL